MTLADNVQRLTQIGYTVTFTHDRTFGVDGVYIYNPFSGKGKSTIRKGEEIKDLEYCIKQLRECK